MAAAVASKALYHGREDRRARGPHRVSPLQQDEVPEMQNTAPEHKEVLYGSQMWRANEHDDDRKWRVEHERAETEEPDEDRPHSRPAWPAGSRSRGQPLEALTQARKESFDKRSSQRDHSISARLLRRLSAISFQPSAEQKGPENARWRFRAPDLYLAKRTHSSAPPGGGNRHCGPQ